MKLWDRIRMWLSKPPKPLHEEPRLRPDNPSNQPFHQTTIDPDEEPKL